MNKPKTDTVMVKNTITGKKEQWIIIGIRRDQQYEKNCNQYGKRR